MVIDRALRADGAWKVRDEAMGEMSRKEIIKALDFGE